MLLKAVESEKERRKDKMILRFLEDAVALYCEGQGWGRGHEFGEKIRELVLDTLG